MLRYFAAASELCGDSSDYCTDEGDCLIGGNMCDIYLMTQGTRAGIENNRMVVSKNGEQLNSVPFQTIDTISVYGNVQLTTQLIGACLSRSVPVSLFTGTGICKGEILSPGSVNVSLQRLQTQVYYQPELCLAFAKTIIRAKIHNQRVLIRRYASVNTVSAEAGIRVLRNIEQKMENADTEEKLMGYEGISARVYFQTLGQLVNPQFAFKGRSKRPPTDPFNALISLGYTLLHNEIGAKISAKGLNPYFGIMHKDRNGHKALASDLIEEWRPVIADALAMSILNGRELLADDFVRSEGGVYLTPAALKKYTLKFRERMDREYVYLLDDTSRADVHTLIQKQIEGVVRVLRKGDAQCYQPVRIR